MRINWYPGHMAKAKRLLSEQLSRVDVVIEVCDARLPLSSRNPDFEKLLAGRERILLLNKSDLAEESVTQKWVSLFKSQGIIAAPFSAINGKQQAILRLIEDSARERVEKSAARGIKKTVRCLVAGVPNVGKSTIINRMKGQRVAEVGDRPGVTRSNQWVKITPYLEILDSPGLLWPRLEDQRAAKRLCYLGTVRDEVVDNLELAIALLEDLLKTDRKKQVMERFKLKEVPPKEDMLEAVCRGRGFLLKGGVADIDRCASVVLDEFRAGKLGRISLEAPRDNAEVKNENNSQGENVGADEA
ncbi:MAG: ribosome biogenesis GTPase YlqF [Eubacteriales bacterium]|nr:ribosome biogenesis GTPase YlqF [Eubacteriales bacterium]MDD3880751.1 ribosome biogenesis GTPase YlqF [Eubacteriales bacterium]MDD3882902.1 ribosome biogenesis GTPase YlqF [Eubacteriales bacterium]MDD4511616.1 ribosome biogenesis GTPase YlqF [Eubacteriales bacterium]